MRQYIGIFFGVILSRCKKFLNISRHIEISKSWTKRPLRAKIKIVPINNKNSLNTLSKTAGDTLLSKLWFSTLKSWSIYQYRLLNPEFQPWLTKYDHVIACCNDINIRIIPRILNASLDQIKICITNTPQCVAKCSLRRMTWKRGTPYDIHDIMSLDPFPVTTNNFLTIILHEYLKHLIRPMNSLYARYLSKTKVIQISCLSHNDIQDLIHVCNERARIIFLHFNQQLPNTLLDAHKESSVYHLHIYSVLSWVKGTTIYTNCFPIWSKLLFQHMF